MQNTICQIQIFHPATSAPIPPANTVMNEKSHSPKDPAAPATWRYRRGAILYISQFAGNVLVSCRMLLYLRTIQPRAPNPTIAEC